MKTYGILHKITGASARVLHWVQLARESDLSIRYPMTLMHVEEGEAVCVSEKRLHTAPVPKVMSQGSDVEAPILPDGDYAVITSKSSMVHLAEIIEDVTFPRWQHVIPTGLPDKGGKYKAFSSKNKTSVFSLEVAKLFELCEYKSPINHDYLSDLNDLSPGEEWLVEYRRHPDPEMGKALVFRHGEAMAVVMPLRMEKE